MRIYYFIMSILIYKMGSLSLSISLWISISAQNSVLFSNAYSILHIFAARYNILKFCIIVLFASP